MKDLYTTVTLIVETLAKIKPTESLSLGKQTVTRGAHGNGHEDYRISQIHVKLTVM